MRADASLNEQIVPPALSVAATSASLRQLFGSTAISPSREPGRATFCKVLFFI